MHRVIHPCGVYLLSQIVIQHTLTYVEFYVTYITYVPYYVKVYPRQVTASIHSRRPGYVVHYPHYPLHSCRYEFPPIHWYNCPVD